MTRASEDKTKTEAEGGSPRENAHALLRRARHARARRVGAFVAAGVGLPTLLAVIYFGFIASPQFESTALLSVSGPHAPGSTAKPSARDALMVRKYALSRAAMARLEEEHRLMAHFQTAAADPLSRLSEDATREEAFSYYGSKVALSFDSASSILTLTVTAFAPEEATRFAEALITYSEEMLQSSSGNTARGRQWMAGPSDTQLVSPQAEALAKRVARARTTGEEDPAADRNASGGTTPPPAATRDLETRDAELIRRALMGASATSPSKPGELLPANSDPAPRIAIIAAPSLPDSATKPRRLTGILTVLALSATFLGIASLLIAAIREHAKI